MILQIITLTSSYNIVGLFKAKSIHMIMHTYFEINKICKSKKAG